MSTTSRSSHATPTPPEKPGPGTANRVVSALVGAGIVPSGRAEEARAVVSRTLDEQPPVGRHGAGFRLAEIAGYVGGALVVAAIGLVVATGWTELSATAQVFVLATITVVLAAAGLAAGKVAGGYAELRAGRDELRRRLTSALLVGAAVAGATTVGRVVELRTEAPTSWPSILGGLTAMVLAAVAYRLVPSALAQLAIAGGAVTTLTSVWSLIDDGSGTTVVPGLSILVTGGVWAALAEGGVFRERVVARSVGVALALSGAQIPVFDAAWVGYLATLAVAVAGFALYLRTVSWPYLVAGVLGITLVVPEAVIDWTDGSLGIAGGVLVAGLTLLGASLAGLRVRREAND